MLDVNLNRGSPQEVMTQRRQKRPSRTAVESPKTVLPDSPNVTRTTSVYHQLRDEILTGQLLPGEKLAAENLRSRFDIGGSPIREALNRLLAENIVVLEEQKGFRVAPVSAVELRELVTARCWIDGIALSESVKRSDEAWEERLILAFHRLRRSERSSPPADHAANTEWEALHRDFHMALVSGCGSSWVTRISEQLFDAAERYRVLGARFVPERNELAEHAAIVDACLERKPELAVNLLESHYGRTLEVVMKHLPMEENCDVTP